MIWCFGTQSMVLQKTTYFFTYRKDDDVMITVYEESIKKYFSLLLYHKHVNGKLEKCCAVRYAKSNANQCEF